MPPPYADPIFTAENDPRVPGWFVQVIWPWGTRTHVRHFTSEAEAQNWIDTQATSWLHGPAHAARLRSRRPVADEDRPAGEPQDGD